MGANFYRLMPVGKADWKLSPYDLLPTNLKSDWWVANISTKNKGPIYTIPDKANLMMYVQRLKNSSSVEVRGVRLSMVSSGVDTPPCSEISALFDFDENPTSQLGLSAFIAQLCCLNNLYRNILNTDRRVDIGDIEVFTRSGLNYHLDIDNVGISKFLSKLKLGSSTETFFRYTSDNFVEHKGVLYFYLECTETLYRLSKKEQELLGIIKWVNIYVYRNDRVDDNCNPAYEINCDTLEGLLSMCLSLPDLMCFDMRLYDETISYKIEIEYNDNRYARAKYDRIDVSYVNRYERVNLYNIITRNIYNLALSK